MTRLEKEMADCDAALDACTRCYLGLPLAEYMQNMRNPVQLAHPPTLPPGFADAAELRARLLALNQTTPEAQRLKELGVQLEAIQKVLMTATPGPLPGIQQEQQRLLAEREQLESRVRAQKQSASIAQWSVLMPNDAPVVVVDGVGFRAELSRLLQRKLDLLCRHRLAVAERIIKVRGQTIARDPAFAVRVNAAAERFQARIAAATGVRHCDWGYVSNLITPLRHEYEWQAHFPCLVQVIPESMPSHGNPTAFLLELSAAIERDRAVALA